MSLSEVGKGGDESPDGCSDARATAGAPEAKVGRYEIVAATTGMDPSSQVPELLGKESLDHRMHILVGSCPHGCFVDFNGDRVARLIDRSEVLSSQQPAGNETARVSFRGREVCTQETYVSTERR